MRATINIIMFGIREIIICNIFMFMIKATRFFFVI